MQNWPRSSPRGRACTKRCVCVVTAKRLYSEDVPALECDRHAEFESSRINTQNFRKEFFRIPMARYMPAPGASFSQTSKRKSIERRLHEGRCAFERRIRATIKVLPRPLPLSLDSRTESLLLVRYAGVEKKYIDG